LWWVLAWSCLGVGGEYGPSKVGLVAAGGWGWHGGVQNALEGEALKRSVVLPFR
jgi:hypothetical protein